ncbi:hypothetical protein HRbin39_00701 [bacterium HR39]|nr:hypothetical protein HRbin39_00701 [bacterium HR39]
MRAVEIAAGLVPTAFGRGAERPVEGRFGRAGELGIGEEGVHLRPVPREGGRGESESTAPDLGRAVEQREQRTRLRPQRVGQLQTGQFQPGPPGPVRIRIREVRAGPATQLVAPCRIEPGQLRETEGRRPRNGLEPLFPRRGRALFRLSGTDPGTLLTGGLCRRSGRRVPLHRLLRRFDAVSGFGPGLARRRPMPVVRMRDVRAVASAPGGGVAPECDVVVRTHLGRVTACRPIGRGRLAQGVTGLGRGMPDR